MSGAVWGALGGAALAGGLAVRRVLRPLPIRGVPVLRWRMIGPILPGSPLNEHRVPRSAFDAQVRHMVRRGLQPMGLGEALRRRGKRGFLASQPVVFTFDGPSASFVSVAYPVLKQHGVRRVTLFFPAAVLGREELTFAQGRPEPLLTAGELRELAGEGVEIGLQAWPSLSTDQGELEGQLRAERAALAEAIGQPVDLVALPPGDPRPVWVRAAREAGFVGGAQVGGTGILGGRTSAFRVPRFRVLPETPLVEVAQAIARRRLR